MQPHDSSTRVPEGGVLVQHRVSGFSESWLVGEAPVPEAVWHDRAIELVRAILEHWIQRSRRDASVFRNLAVRVRRDMPKVGFDADLIVVEPAPSNAGDLSSLRLWQPGHAVPALVIEVVSPGHPYKDYTEIPDRCAAIGVGELAVFDPLLVGPRAFGGPQRIQLWKRTDRGTFERTAAGEGPLRSSYLDAFLVVAEGGRKLRIADDEAASRLWLTREEAALARIEELEGELGKRLG